MYTHEDYIKDKIMAESGAKGWEADQARFRCYEYEHGRPYSANASFAKSEAGLQQKLNRIVAEEQQIHEYIRSYIGTEDFLYVQQQMEPKLKRLEKEYEETLLKHHAQPKGGCYVATAVYGSYDCPEVWTLRRFRDNTLAETCYGRAFIHVYYAISPTLVKWFGDADWFKNIWRAILNKMVKKLQGKGVENTPYKDKDWK